MPEPPDARRPARESRLPLKALPDYVCPRCHGALRHDAQRYRCASCRSDYPIVLGIPDFRVLPDPWIGMEDDRAKAVSLEEASAELDLAQTVRAYWAMTPGTPTHLAERFTQHVLGAAQRSAEWLDLVEVEEGPPPPGPWLDVGCGTGDLADAGTRRGATIVGIDIALRWLVVARRRAQREGYDTRPLICCNAEYLPFPDASFARVLSLGTLEHCADAGRVISEARRVLAPGGTVRVRTVNRFTLLPEPHVGVWGVGLMPRPWADAYVRWRNGQRYLHHRPLSRRELRHSLRQAGLAPVRVWAAPFLAAERKRLGPLAWAVPVYNGMRLAPGVGALLGWVAPLLEASGRTAR